MHRLNKEFDKVICINLLERQDKKDFMQKKFNELGLQVEWFNTVQYGFTKNIINPIVDSKAGHFNKQTPNEIGASLSHYTVIKKALLEGCNKIFVFEDDAKLHNDFNSKLDSYLDDIPSNWDAMLLYSFMYEILPQNVRVSKRWIKSYKSWSLMAYGMKRNVMEEYIKMQDNFFCIADLVTYKMQETNKFNIYSAIPTLCIPSINLGSNIRGINMNYETTNTVINTGYSNENYK